MGRCDRAKGFRSDTQDAINVNVDQKGLGVLWANWIIKHVPNGGKVLEVRGVAGTSVDTDRHNGIQETFKASGKTWNVVEVVGKWDDATAQKASDRTRKTRSTSTSIRRASAFSGPTGSSSMFPMAGRSLKFAAWRAPRSIPIATMASRRRSKHRARPGTSWKSSANGTMRPRKRLPIGHARRDQRQRRSEGPRRSLGQLDHQACSQWREGP